jgi:hypothetical protein
MMNITLTPPSITLLYAIIMIRMVYIFLKHICLCTLKVVAAFEVIMALSFIGWFTDKGRHYQQSVKWLPLFNYRPLFRDPPRLLKQSKDVGNAYDGDIEMNSDPRSKVPALTDDRDKLIGDPAGRSLDEKALTKAPEKEEQNLVSTTCFVWLFCFRYILFLIF